MFHVLFHLGITLVIGFDYVEALDATWRMYNKSDELAKLMHRLFITDELLKRMRVKISFEIRTRMWEDEYLKCRSEITSGQPGRTPIYKKSKIKHQKTVHTRVSHVFEQMPT